METQELEVLYMVRMCYDFEGTSSDELSVKEGEAISVTKVLGGWSVGVKKDGTFGYFPTNYAEKITMDEVGISANEREERIVNNSKETSALSTIPYQPKYSKKEAVQKIGAYWKCYLFRKHANKFLKNIRVRINLVKELIHSEQNYVEYLTCMRDLYINPFRERLKNKKKILSEAEISQLFGNLEQLLDLALQMLDELMRASVDSSKDLIQVFMRILPFLKLYVVYVQNYDKAVTLMSEKQKKDKEFSSFIKSARADPRSKGLELRDLISKPFQRIFAYKNIFNRMIELTPKESASYPKLEALDQKMEDLVQFINESKRQYENQQKLSQRISNSWGSDNRMHGLLLKRWRKYVREGRLRITYPIGSEKEIWVDCFLANDVFFFIKDNQLRTMYIFLTELIENPVDDRLVIDLYSYPKESNSCRVKFSEEQEKKDWVTDLYRCIEKEKKFAIEHGIQGNLNEVIQKWITTLKIMDDRHHELEIYKEKLKNNKEELRGVKKHIESLRQDIQECMRKTAKYSADRKLIANTRASLITEQEKCLKDIAKTIEMGKETKALFDTLFRNEEDAFSSVFSNSYKTFVNHLNYFSSFEEDNSSPDCDRIDSSEIVIPFSIINDELKQEFQSFKFNYAKELEGLMGMIHNIDYDEQIFELISNNLSLQQKYSALHSRMKLLEQENTFLKKNLANTHSIIQDLQKETISLIESKSATNSQSELEDTTRELTILIKNSEYQLLKDQIASSEEVLALKKEKTLLQDELLSTKTNIKELKEKIKELESSSLKSGYHILPETLNNNTEYNRDKKKANILSDISPKEKKDLDTDQYLQTLTYEMNSLQQKLQIIRKESELEIKSLLKQMETLNSIYHNQVKASALLAKKLDSKNSILMEENESYRKMVIESEDRLQQMYKQILESNEELYNQNKLIHDISKDNEKTKADMFKLQYQLIKTKAIFNENEKLKKRLVEEKSSNNNAIISRKSLEAKLNQAEEETRRLTVLLNSEKANTKKHHSMINLAHSNKEQNNELTAISSSHTGSLIKPPQASSPQLPQRDSKPLPVPTRKNSGGSSSLLPPPAPTQSPDHSPPPLPLQQPQGFTSIITNTLKSPLSMIKTPSVDDKSSPRTNDKEKESEEQSKDEESKISRAKRSQTNINTRLSIPAKLEEAASTNNANKMADRRSTRDSNGRYGTVIGGGSFESILQEMRKKRNMNS